MRNKETKSISTFFLQVESRLGDPSSQYPQRRNRADYFVVADQECWYRSQFKGSIFGNNDHKRNRPFSVGQWKQGSEWPILLRLSKRRLVSWSTRHLLDFAFRLTQGLALEVASRSLRMLGEVATDGHARWTWDSEKDTHEGGIGCDPCRFGAWYLYLGISRKYVLNYFRSWSVMLAFWWTSPTLSCYQMAGGTRVRIGSPELQPLQPNRKRSPEIPTRNKPNLIKSITYINFQI